MKKLTIALCVLVLSGCAAGPSKGEMEQALLTWMHENASKSMVIDDFKAGSCAKSESQPGYSCSLQAAVSHTGGKDTVQGTFVFDQIEGDWKVVGRTN